MTDVVFNAITDNLFFGNENWINEKKAYFCDVTYDYLAHLCDLGLLLNKRIVYYGPSTQEYLSFLANHPNFTAHGYVEVIDGDPNIELDGLYCGFGFNEEQKSDFLRFSVTSDTLRTNEIFLYSRWN